MANIPMTPEQLAAFARLTGSPKNYARLSVAEAWHAYQIDLEVARRHARARNLDDAMREAIRNVPPAWVSWPHIHAHARPEPTPAWWPEGADLLLAKGSIPAPPPDPLREMFLGEAERIFGHRA